SLKAKTIKHSIAWTFLSVSVLGVVDFAFSILAFLLAYKTRQDAPVFIWSRLQSMPIGIAPQFAPYFSLLIFVPFVKLFALQRYGFYKLRGEFSFSGDFFRIIKAATFSFTVLVVIAFLFRQGFSIRDGEIIKNDFSYSRLIFVYDWLFAMLFFWMTLIAVRLIRIVTR